MCVLDGEESRVVASTALVAEQMAVYQPVTMIVRPVSVNHSPPYECHTGSSAISVYVRTFTLRIACRLAI